MSYTQFKISYNDVTKCPREARESSPMNIFLENSESNGSDRYT